MPVKGRASEPRRACLVAGSAGLSGETKRQGKEGEDKRAKATRREKGGGLPFSKAGLAAYTAVVSSDGNHRSGGFDLAKLFAQLFGWDERMGTWMDQIYGWVACRTLLYIKTTKKKNNHRISWKYKNMLFSFLVVDSARVPRFPAQIAACTLNTPHHTTIYPRLRGDE